MAILSNTEFGILRLTISRAQKRNSINAEMFDTMTEPGPPVRPAHR